MVLKKAINVKIRKIMKKLVFLSLIMMLFTLSSCKNITEWLGKSSQKNEEIEKVDDFLKVPEYKTEPYVPSTYSASKYSGDSTYWYVVLNADDARWHACVELATPYFDFVEARKQFEGAKGKGYFEFFIQITKESDNSYYKYAK